MEKKLPRHEYKKIVFNLLNDVLNRSKENTFNQLVFKKYIELGGATNLAKYLNDNGYRVKTKSGKGNRKFVSIDITEFVLDKKNQTDIDIDLVNVVTHLANYVGHASWDQRLIRVLRPLYDNYNIR